MIIVTSVLVRFDSNRKTVFYSIFDESQSRVSGWVWHYKMWVNKWQSNQFKSKTSASGHVLGHGHVAVPEAGAAEGEAMGIICTSTATQTSDNAAR